MAKVALRVGMRELSTPEDLVDARSRGSGDSRTLLQDEIHILYNPVVFEEVAWEVGPEVLLAPYDPFAKDSETTPPWTRAFHQLQHWLRGAANAEKAPSVEQAAPRVATASAIGICVRTWSIRSQPANMLERIVVSEIGEH